MTRIVVTVGRWAAKAKTRRCGLSEGWANDRLVGREEERKREEWKRQIGRGRESGREWERVGSESESESDSESKNEREREREWERERVERDRKRQEETGRDRKRQRETERDRETERQQDKKKRGN